MLTSAFILVFVAAALWQFSFAYRRRLLAKYSRVELSGQVEQMTGLTMDTIEPSEFDRLMVLVRVAPDPTDDATEITAINLYYRAMQLAKAVTSFLPGQASNWCRSELGRCSYFAAVTLD
jgi:hypothetical protein